MTAQSVHGGVVPNPVYVPICTAGEDGFQSRERDEGLGLLC